MKLKLIMLVSVFALGLAFNANAGSVTDLDADLVPDTFDNCTGISLLSRPPCGCFWLRRTCL